jgi:hypothetical protein
MSRNLGRFVAWKKEAPNNTKILFVEQGSRGPQTQKSIEQYSAQNSAHSACKDQKISKDSVG